MTHAMRRGTARMTWLRPSLEQTKFVMGITHRKLLDAIRDTKRTLYAVAAFYVAVGFIFAIVSLNAGALLGTFLGFLIVSGTLVTTAMLRTMMRIHAQISSMQESAERIESRLSSLEHAGSAAESPRARVEEAHQVDLASTNTKEVSGITAAVLDRDSFPRLVTLLGASSDTEFGRLSGTAHAHESGKNAGARSSDNVQRAWKRAMREGDLVAARLAFSALVESVDPRTIESLRAELTDLQGRTERSLRRSVSECVARQDLDGLLEVIREVRRQLPGNPMADECAKLEPTLRRRMERAADNTCDNNLELDEDLNDGPPETRREDQSQLVAHVTT